ncbi:UDP-N-acetylglucosamine 4,6-dehydratase (inverting) [Patescibacteria group bacterium]|nr:UDP-N-acetylglucosamine 4,6-dehydratase (inverting) [Patescibacteria group bacterium]MBU2472538.1 UDP-N-acetylglucosamine 4,6-dehydratase (inverting) [Patescibacteria group bacterium]
MFNDKTVLVTGGTGSFGEYFVFQLLKLYRPKKVIVFSRDEFKQFRMQKKSQYNEKCRFFLGDIRDITRLKTAFNNVDYVIHAAALKQVPTLEYNPFEAIKTNIIGSQNVIEAAIEKQVKKVLLISTDKAVHPINLYGATKLCAEKLFISSNAYSPNKTFFSVVRYGNVLGSRGSIVETLLKSKSQKAKITSMEMTRFWINLNQAFQLVNFALKNMVGGEIFVPKIPSMKLVDLFNILRPKEKKEIMGIRPGEKIHEELISTDEAKNTFNLDKYYVVLPNYITWGSKTMYDKYKKLGTRVDNNFCYTSNANNQWLTKTDLEKQIRALTE